MAHKNCDIAAPHKKHDVNVGNMRYDIYERCAGIPTAEKVLRDKQKAERKELKADLKHAKKMLRLEAKWDKMGRMRSTRTADDRL
jgi:hypothetical protein